MKRAVLATAAFLFMSVSTVLADGLIWNAVVENGEAVDITMCVVTKGEAECPESAHYMTKSKIGSNIYEVNRDVFGHGLGFGRQENQAIFTPYAAVHPGAYDWGGHIVGGTFVPLYVIKRFYIYDWTDEHVSDDQTHLVIFRLLHDGTSCIVDTNGGVTADNGVARKWAEIDSDDPKCLKEIGTPGTRAP